MSGNALGAVDRRGQRQQDGQVPWRGEVERVAGSLKGGEQTEMTPTEVTSRWHLPLRDPRLWGWVVLGALGLCLQLLWLVCGGVTRSGDTASYFDLGISAHHRFPVVPLIYTMLRNGTVIAVVQAVAVTVAWVTFAAVATSGIGRAVPRWVTATLVVLAGSTPGFATSSRWLLSEAISVTLLVLTLSVLLLLVRVPSRRLTVVFFLLAFAWMATRPQNVVLALMASLSVLVGAMIASLVRRPVNPEVRIAVLVLLLLSLTVLPVALRNHDLQRANMAQIIDARVLSERGAYRWWRDRGMPTRVDVIARSAPGRYAVASGLAADPEVAQWIDSEGNKTYATFLLNHPSELLRPVVRGFWAGSEVGPADRTPVEVGPLLFPDDTLLRPVRIPRWVDSVVGITVAITGVAAAVGARRRAKGWTPTAGMGVVCMGLGVAFLLPSWLGAGFELERLALMPAVVFRIGLLLGVVSWCETRWPVGGVSGSSLAEHRRHGVAYRSEGRAGDERTRHRGGSEAPVPGAAGIGGDPSPAERPGTAV